MQEFLHSPLLFLWGALLVLSFKEARLGRPEAKTKKLQALLKEPYRSKRYLCQPEGILEIVLNYKFVK